MSIGFSKEWVELFSITKLIAERLQSPRNSLHLLLGNFIISTNAGELLKKQGISESTIIESFDKFEHIERPNIVKKLMALSQLIGESLNSRELNSLHLLIAFTSEKNSFAYRVLENITEELAILRKCAINLIKSEVGINSSYKKGRNKVRRIKTTSNEYYSYSKQKNLYLKEYPENNAITVPNTISNLLEKTEEDREEFSFEQDKDIISFAQKKKEHSFLTENENISDITAELERVKLEYSQKYSNSLQFRDKPGSISSREFPFLSKFGRNLTLLAHLGKIDPLIGRKKEIEEILDILGKRRVNNPCLIGEPGVGKTAIVEGLAAVGARGEHPFLADKVIVQLDIGALKAGTHLRGSLSERLKGIREEVKKARGKIIIFIDEIHMIAGGGNDPDGNFESWNELKTALSRGEFPCIGATTIRDYKLYIEPDPALVRRFHMVQIREPSPAEAEEILLGVIERYSQFHRVSFSPEAIRAAVRLSEQYIGGLQLPAKAIDLLDLAASRARRENLSQVSPSLIVDILANKTGIAKEKIAISIGKGNFGHFEKELKKKIFGRDEQIKKVISHLRKNTLLYTHDRPQGSFLFVGPPSTGKRFFAQTLGSILYGSKDSILEIDLSEYTEPVSASRLIGAPPGYIGYEEGGILTESVRLKPYQIVVFSNVASASKEIFPLLHSILNRGELVDSKGRHVSFSNTIIIFTLNKELTNNSKTVGFISHPSNRTSQLRELLRQYIPPEILELLDDILPFKPLENTSLEKLLSKIVEDTLSELSSKLSIKLLYDQNSVKNISKMYLNYNPTKINIKTIALEIKKTLEESLSRSVEENSSLLSDISKLKVESTPDGKIFWKLL